MIDEGLDLRFKACWEEVVIQQDAVFQYLMPSLDLALCLSQCRYVVTRGTSSLTS